MRKLAMLAALACLLGTTAIASAETAEEVQKKISKLNESITSVQYTTKMEQSMKQEGFSMESKSNGKMIYVKKGDSFLMRSEDKSESTMDVAGNKSTTKADTLSVNDGDIYWSYDKTTKVANKMKMPKDKQPKIDPTEAWKDFDLKLLPDETVDGQSCWCIEATPKDPVQKATMSRSVWTYEKKYGQIVKMVTYMPDGKPMMTMTMSDHKINEKIDPKLFKFEPPSDATVNDMTAMNMGE